jgi:transcription-repair coupling factor (superfamily II helicase)
VGELSGGFRLLSEGLVVLTEDEALGFRPEGRRRKETRPLQDLTSLADLAEGDCVVHLDHGIGLYRGLVKLTVGSEVNDFLELEYQGGDRLYLPVDRLNLVQKYLGVEGASPRVARLGGKSWERAKTRVKKAVEKIARELVELYALRRVLPGHHFSPPDPVYREFEATFAYEETPDQLQAVADVLADMTSEKPMDRLICGDVGYGKTEVAVRAAFKAAMDGKQVAVLVPTTVLAEQHYETFRSRLAHFPLEVRALSRFRGAAEQKRILADLAQGKVDILIGTHRLLSKDVAFRDLGLAIVDEEQRFGVRQKERLKEWRRTVDCLTLTATPIPRTLQLSLTGLRELSLINTPPENRRAIRTYVCLPETAVIQSAIRRELDRGGQVFFVHNRVRSLATWTRHVREMVPEARVAMAHGQMPEKELEQVMVRFWRREVDVLVCTAIIEAGLDIPAANTIIINRAHTMGLAQLYQLRGRVGRSQAQAYAYLLVPDEAALTREAQKRLKALMEFTELGSGFRIAMHDLQIRGAGNLLGQAQSGHLLEVGYELYLQLLESAIRIKGTHGGGDAGRRFICHWRLICPRIMCPMCSSAWRSTGACRAGWRLIWCGNWKRNFWTASGRCPRRGAISWRWSGPNTVCGSWGSSAWIFRTASRCCNLLTRSAWTCRVCWTASRSGRVLFALPRIKTCGFTWRKPARCLGGWKTA